MVTQQKAPPVVRKLGEELHALVIAGEMRPCSLYYKGQRKPDVWVVLGVDPAVYADRWLDGIYGSRLPKVHAKRDSLGYDSLRSEFRGLRNFAKKFDIAQYVLDEVRKRNLAYKHPEASAVV